MIKIEQEKLGTFCAVMSAMVQECRLKITKDGIITRAVDTANVALVQVILPNTSFKEFTIEPCEIGMDVQKWKGALGVMKPDDMVSIDAPKNGRVTISGGGYDYKINPLDCTTIRKDPNVPNFQLPCTLSISGKEFAEAVKALSIISDKVRLSIRGKTLELSAEGDTDALKKEIEGVIPDGKKNEIEAVSLFSLDYMREITKGGGMKGAETVTISLGIDHPVRLDFDIDGLEGAYVIAPRISQDGE
jgi:proliferating cell nuclear antigen